MADASDMELMRQYADDQAESAFAELVRRHINLVYSVAVRHVGNPALFLWRAPISALLSGGNQSFFLKAKAQTHTEWLPIK